jgi:hypothetical protein
MDVMNEIPYWEHYSPNTVHKLHLTSGAKDPIMCALSTSESVVTAAVHRAVVCVQLWAPRT